MDVLIAKDAKSKVYHRKSCMYRQRIKYYNRSNVNIATAKKMGYGPCKCCFSLKHKFELEKTNINFITKNTDIVYQLIKDELFIRTEASLWKVVYLPDKNMFILYHFDLLAIPDVIPEFLDVNYELDESAGLSDSITKVFSYIINYDESLLGYSMTIRHKLKNDFPLIEKYVREYDMEYDVIGNNIIVTTDIGIWKIVYESEKDLFFLYHGNYYPDLINIRDYIGWKYHRQWDVKCSRSVMDYLKYIKKHDEFRLNEISKLDDKPQLLNNKKLYKKLKFKEEKYTRAKARQYCRIIYGRTIIDACRVFEELNGKKVDYGERNSRINV